MVGEPRRRGHVTKQRFKERVAELRELLLEAQFEQRETGEHALLLLLAGPNGPAKVALGGRLAEWLDTRFVATHAFAAPGPIERGMPWLWRYWWTLPGRGDSALFYGSWYNDLLLAHLEDGAGEAHLENALRRINAFERMLSLEGIRILKIWLATAGTSRADEAAEREACWRDLHPEPARWQPAAETVFRITSTGHAPWVVVDGDDDRSRDLEVGELVLELLGSGPAGAADEPAVASPALERARPAAAASFDFPERPPLEHDAYSAELTRQQGRLSKVVESDAFAERSLLVVFEGVDAAGKGGAIRRLGRALDPRRLEIHPYGAPNDQERRYPYLWRFWLAVPRRGRVAVFDRSHYGRVLVERVEGLSTPAQWGRAYGEITEFEQQLVESGVIVQKFWLAITKDEQLRRFEARRTTPWKRHKITEEDWRNREKWDEYQNAAAEMLERTDLSAAPWHVVDSGDKRRARIEVLDTLNREVRKALKQSR